MDSYTYFLYLGVALFFAHIAIYGFGLHISYFSLILIYVGYMRPVLSNWIINMLWFFVALDVYSNVVTLRKRITNYFYGDKTMVKIKEGVETKQTETKQKQKQKQKQKPKTKTKTKTKP